MTSWLPSARVVVPSSEDFALPLALGLAVVVSGGQSVAQSPLQALFAPWSASHRYRARPLASTRNVPSELVRVVMVEAGRGELLAGALAAVPDCPSARCRAPTERQQSVQLRLRRAASRSPREGGRERPR